VAGGVERGGGVHQQNRKEDKMKKIIEELQSIQ